MRLQALDHVAGYTISHDVSEREFHLRSGAETVLEIDGLGAQSQTFAQAV
jgi:2-keto-4-pentenoate hydratase/2-oxohepta-3-ene-1,7-dioic acid hydratase in catechol pathway